MTIFFSGQDYKYELEGICKLFFPLKKFKHCYDQIVLSTDEDYIITRLKKHSKTTLLWVRVKVGTRIKSAHIRVENDDVNYSNGCERNLSTLLYSVLSELTSINPSWGILTGVRPVAILQKQRAQGKSDEEIIRFFKEKYLVSDDKLDLAFKTANTQAKLLEDTIENSYSLYISIPFCVSRCSYCSFVSHAIDRPNATDKIDEYIDLLCIELEETSHLAKKLRLTLDTIYIGGGTPTALSAENLQRVTDAITQNFDVPSAREYTIEAGRADTITREKLEVIKNSGAKRISVNPQTFNDAVLQEIGRKHTAKQAEDCYHLAKEMKIDCINMDFIAGLPTDTFESFKHTIDKAIELAPTNITVHTLSIKRSADLFTADGIEEYAKSNMTGKMTEYAKEKIIKAGYMPYYLYRQKNTIGNLENVGYAMSGYESLYNVYIMDEMQTILACGAGGVTKLVGNGEKPIERIFNFKYHFEYISRFSEILDRKARVISFYDKGV
ncbi:MAG: coproporphyrinogen dehydrogenase HemZ [Oscillospiraceae bacterium]